MGGRSSKGRAHLASALAGLCAACAGGSAESDRFSYPDEEGPVQIERAVRRSVYWDAVLVRDGVPLRLLFPSGADCDQLLAPEGSPELVYAQGGSWGELRGSAGTCTPVGIADLEQWRDRRETPDGPPSVRGQAHFRIVFTDAHYALARGRFPLARALGWPGHEDAVALIPRGPTCDAPLGRGVAPLELRIEGAPALSLLSDQGVCPIEGLALPLPGL